MGTAAAAAEAATGVKMGKEVDTEGDTAVAVVIAAGGETTTTIAIKAKAADTEGDTAEVAAAADTVVVVAAADTVVVAAADTAAAVVVVIAGGGEATAIAIKDPSKARTAEAEPRSPTRSKSNPNARYSPLLLIRFLSLSPLSRKLADAVSHSTPFRSDANLDFLGYELR